MDNRILAIINNKEGQNVVGKTVKSLVANDETMLITFHDDSTLEIEVYVSDYQALYLNKDARNDTNI